MWQIHATKVESWSPSHHYSSWLTCLTISPVSVSSNTFGKQFHWDIVCGKNEYLYSFVFLVILRNLCPCLSLVLVSTCISISFFCTFTISCITSILWAFSSQSHVSLLLHSYSCVICSWLYHILLIVSRATYCVTFYLLYHMLLPVSHATVYVPCYLLCVTCYCLYHMLLIVSHVTYFVTCYLLYQMPMAVSHVTDCVTC